jgi:excisionase family DNA binding protein
LSEDTFHRLELAVRWSVSTSAIYHSKAAISGLKVIRLADQFVFFAVRLKRWREIERRTNGNQKRALDGQELKETRDIRTSEKYGREVSKQVETSPTLERKRAKYTVEDVRQLCGGISRSTVMREIRRKRLACYRARRTLRFSEEHITKYLERVEHGRTVAGNGPGKQS